MEKQDSKKGKKMGHLLSVLMLCTVMFLTLCGFSMNMEATLKHNGKGSAVLTFETDASLEEFKAVLNKKITSYNSISAANTQTSGKDMLIVKSIDEIENGYSVGIAFRRIDKLLVSGRFELGRLSEYLENYLVNPNLNAGDLSAEDLINYKNQTLVKWNKGDMTGITVDGLDQMMVVQDKEDLTLKAQPKTVSGEDVDIDTFISEGKKAKKNTEILTFFILGVDDVSSVQMTFPGRVTYYAGEGIEIIGDDTVKMTPSAKMVQVKGQGNEISLNKEEVGCLIGYIVYEESISAGTVVALVTGIVLLGGLAVFLFLSLKRKGIKAMQIQNVQTDVSAFKMGIQAARKSETWKNVVRHKSLYLFVLPAVILFLLFNYAPMFGLAIAFQDYNIQDGVFGSEFIGFSMFKKILVDYDANYRSFRNTIFIALIRIVTNFPIILVSTLFVNELRNKKVKTLLTTVSYIPYFISWVAIGGMTHNLFAVDGILNKLLTSLGMETLNWYAEPDLWWPILTITSLWKGLGWSTLIYVSNLGLINNELYEACKIDGGGKIRQAMTVTIPGILNVIIMQLILDVGGIMNDNYDQIRALTKGSEAINETVHVIGTLEFNNTMAGRYTEGAVFGLIRGVIGLIMVLLTDKLAKSTDSEGVL